MNWLGYRMIVQTRELTNDMGIYGGDYCATKGFKWEEIKKFMKIEGGFLVIDLDELHQK